MEMTNEICVGQKCCEMNLSRKRQSRLRDFAIKLFRYFFKESIYYYFLSFRFDFIVSHLIILFLFLVHLIYWIIIELLFFLIMIMINLIIY